MHPARLFDHNQALTALTPGRTPRRKLYRYGDPFVIYSPKGLFL